MSENNGRDPPDRKIGDQALAAYASLGLEELRAAMYPGSNVARPTEPGMYGDRSHSDVYGDRREAATEERHSPLADKIKEIESARDVREQDPPEQTRD